jgi:pyruvate formate lyase activating enzyme|tara:strand:+ start:5830 stop:6528 length:699 start_codon:yes stop_codon:yes gene_type:complete
MKLKGLVETSFVDWDGKICSVVFTPGCNFKCPFCFNGALVLDPDSVDNVPEQALFDLLEKHKDFLDGVCITGGEPTLSPDLADFCKKIKDKGFLVKLDTNGATPEILKSLIENKLLDFIAMDVKGPWENYSDFAGVPIDGEKIKESVRLIMDSGLDYEFRTTLVPSLHTPDVFEKLVSQIKGAKKYCVQKFRPGFCIDKSLNTDQKQTDEEMNVFAETARKYIDNVKVRGEK